MVGGLVLAAVTLVGPALLIALSRREVLDRSAGVFLGAISGAAAGAGALVGMLHQPTTAYIDSGYSFASVLEWILLAAGGGIAGAVIGGLVGRRLPRWRAGVAVVAVLGVLGSTGWVVDGQRETIDCEDRADFCDRRYGD
jgi:hypothetical protein